MILSAPKNPDDRDETIRIGKFLLILVSAPKNPDDRDETVRAREEDPLPISSAPKNPDDRDETLCFI